MARATFPGRCFLVILFLTLALVPTAAPKADAPRAEPIISPEQAIALATGRSPHSAGGEMGDNDFRISDMGGDLIFDALNPDVAYNSADSEYLVVWEGTTSSPPAADDKQEVFGRRLDAASGAAINDAFLISDMGADGAAHDPAIAYNAIDNEYLVVWQGATTSALDYEIHGQRIEADSGAHTGDSLVLSVMGPSTGQELFDAWAPAVTWNGTANRHLVVWHGDDGTGSMVDNEDEIWGRVIRGSNGEDISGDIRISDMGGDGVIHRFGRFPAVTYNETDSEYLVVWSGCDTICTKTSRELEIYGQRLDAGTLLEDGNNDFRISNMGPDGDPLYVAKLPAVASTLTGSEVLVVWHGDDDRFGLLDDEFEIFGQRYEGPSGFSVFLPMVLRK